MLDNPDSTNMCHLSGVFLVGSIRYSNAQQPLFHWKRSVSSGSQLILLSFLYSRFWAPRNLLSNSSADSLRTIKSIKSIHPSAMTLLVNLYRCSTIFKELKRCNIKPAKCSCLDLVASCSHRKLRAILLSKFKIAYPRTVCNLPVLRSKPADTCWPSGWDFLPIWRKTYWLSWGLRPVHFHRHWLGQIHPRAWSLEGLLPNSHPELWW